MTKTKEPSTPKGSAFNSNKTYPARKDLGSIKHKFSPVKKIPSKHNNVFVKGFKFGLMCLKLKKSTDPNEDKYIKDFLDVYVCESSKCSIPKYSASGYKARYLLGIAPVDKEHDESFRHMWAEKIIMLTKRSSGSTQIASSLGVI
jgi:hypothetical protein